MIIITYNFFLHKRKETNCLLHKLKIHSATELQKKEGGGRYVRGAIQKFRVSADNPLGFGPNFAFRVVTFYIYTAIATTLH